MSNGKQAQQQRYTMQQCPQRPPTPQARDQYHVPGQQGVVGVSPAQYQQGVAVGVGVQQGQQPQQQQRGAPPVRPLQPPTPPQTDLKGGGYGQQGRQQGQSYQQYRAALPQQQPSQRPVPQHRQHPGHPGVYHAQSFHTQPTLVYPMGPQFSQQGAQRQQAAYYHQQLVAPVPYYSPYPQQNAQFYLPQGGGQPPTQLSMAASHPQSRAPPVVAPASVQQQPPQQPQSHPIVRYSPQLQMAQPPQTSEKKPVRRAHAIAIVDPQSGKDVMEDFLEPKTGEASEERRPSKQDEEGQAVVEEFARLVSDAANERDPGEEGPPPPEADRARPETPVVSAMSDSPEIVPKQGPPHKTRVQSEGAGGEAEKSAGGARRAAAAGRSGGEEDRQSPLADGAERPPTSSAREEVSPDAGLARRETSPVGDREVPVPEVPVENRREFSVEREISVPVPVAVSAEEVESEEEVRTVERDENKISARVPEDSDPRVIDGDVEKIADVLGKMNLESEVSARDETDDATIPRDVDVRRKTEIVIEEKVKNDENATEKFDKNDAADEDESSDDASSSDDTDDDDDSEKVKPENVDAEKAPAVPMLRYNYKEDQWSPLNTSGRKCYDADFLLLLRDDPNSKKKPENILKPELLADNLSKVSRGPDKSSRFSMGSSNDMLPGFARGTLNSSTPNRKSQHGKINSKSGTPGGSLKPNVININLTLKTDVKLNESENAWKPSRADRTAPTGEDEIETQNIYKKFRSILNKLTPQKFDKLIAQIRQLNINTYERLDGVITLVFEKAINEPNFSVEYAMLCRELSKINVSTTDPKKEKCSFQTLLIEKCKEEFYKEDKISEDRLKEIEECTDPEKKKELKLLLEEEERSIRRRSVGNVRFIGELFKQSFMNNSVILSCINRLLSKIEEETLECLCKLLTTIGKDLEQKQRFDLSPTFKEMKKIVDTRDKRVTSRIRFMIQDVIELRINNWVPRQTQMVNPKMMDQIKLEMEMEQSKSSFSNYSSGSAQRSDDRPSNMNKRGGSRSVTEEGWLTAPVRSRMKPLPFDIDTEKLRSISATPVTLTALQPSTVLSWSRGSNTHKKGDSNTLGSRMPTSNRKNTEITLNNSYAKLDMQHDSSVSDEPSEPSVAKVPYKSKGASIERSTFKFEQISDSKEEDVKNRLHSFIQEYAESSSEILKKIKNLFVKEEYQILFKELIIWSLSTLKISINKSVGEVTGMCVRDKTISNSDYLTALKSAVESTKIFNKSDKNCWKAVSALVCTHMKYSYLSLQQIHTAFSKVIEIGKGFGLLTYIVIEEGEKVMRELWKESDMKLSDWMSEDEVEQFLEEIPFSSHFVSEEDEELISPDAAYNKMLQMMKDNCSRDDLTSWIKQKVGESDKDAWFVRALTEAIFMYVLCGSDGSKPRFDTEAERRLSVYYPLLITHVSNGPELELQCLFAIQNLMNKLEHPRDIARKIFEYFLDSGDVISTKGFLDWKKNNDSHELEGKGVMLKYLNSFFIEIEVYGGESSESENGEDH